MKLVSPNPSFSLSCSLAPPSSTPVEVATAATPRVPALTPLALAVGDYAVFPGHGVVEVVSVGPRELGGREEVFYGCRALNDGTRLFVPARRLECSGLRRLVLRHEVPRVLATLRAPPPPHRMPCFKWHQVLIRKVNSGELIAIAEVLRDVTHVKHLRELSATERHILDIVEEHVVCELALVLGRDRKRVAHEVGRTVRAA